MILDLLITIAFTAPLLFLSAIVYVQLLLLIAWLFGGVLKMIISMALYFGYAVVFLLPMFYLISEHREAIQNSNLVAAAVLASFALSASPALYYIGKVKMKALQRAGYFLPRRQSSNLFRD